MNSALAWINDLALWVGQFVPRWVIVKVNEGGLRFNGHTTSELHSGVNFYWPARTKIQIIPIVRRTLQTPTQVLVGHSFLPNAVAAVVTFHIFDVTLALRDNWKLGSLIEDETQNIVSTHVSGKDLRKLDVKVLAAALTEEVSEALKPYGVGVEKVGIVHLTPSIPIKHLNDWATSNSDNI